MTRLGNRRRKAGKALRWSVVAAAALLAACQNDVRVHGNLPDPEVIAEIQPGLDGREDVAQLLGTPSTVSAFQDDIWYYIGQKSEQFAFFKRDVLERKVLVISFDQTGTVDTARTLTLADSREIDPVDRETPTEGRDLTLLQQLFGNIGRFPTDTIQGN
jgi:outer membrane protein assembly factor BamE (lipoprotein component of BamABCDE complex)